MVVLKNGILTAEIDETGAQLIRLASESTEYLWNGSPEIWKRHAPVLFPFVGRLKEQKYIFKGKEYGPIDNHGFAPVATFVPFDLSNSFVRMKMVVSDSIKAVYPFDFSFSVCFELTDSTLKISYEVKNNGKETMYYGIGNHPGFNVPLKSGLGFEDYYIEFPEAGQIEKRLLNSEGLDTGKKEICRETSGNRLSLRHDLFDNDAIVLINTGTRAILKSDKDSKKVIVDYPESKYCAFWHKVKYPAPYVCIEPWDTMPGVSDGITDLEKKADYLKLDKSEARIHHLNISIVDG